MVRKIADPDASNSSGNLHRGKRGSFFSFSSHLELFWSTKNGPLFLAAKNLRGLTCLLGVRCSTQMVVMHSVRWARWEHWERCSMRISVPNAKTLLPFSSSDAHLCFACLRYEATGSASLLRFRSSHCHRIMLSFTVKAPPISEQTQASLQQRETAPLPPTDPRLPSTVNPLAFMSIN